MAPAKRINTRDQDAVSDLYGVDFGIGCDMVLWVRLNIGGFDLQADAIDLDKC